MIRTVHPKIPCVFQSSNLITLGLTYLHAHTTVLKNNEVLTGRSIHVLEEFVMSRPASIWTVNLQPENASIIES